MFNDKVHMENVTIIELHVIYFIFYFENENTKARKFA